MEVTKIPKKTVIRLDPQKSLLVDKEKYHQKRIAAYCRVSTDNEEQLTSYKNQKKFYMEMIAKNKEWQLAGIYADEGISGTRADKRPEFKRMIKDCLSGKIDYIITKSVSRFARNTVDCLDYVRMLKGKGVGILFEEQNIDTLKIESEMLLVMFAGFAQSESESISKNVTWSYRKKYEAGTPFFMYKKMLGYKKGKDGKPEIVPEEAKIVRRIYDMYLAGMTSNQISKTLVDEKTEVPGKNLTFGRKQIMNILKNEKYCGDCILQKTVTLDCISKKRKRNEGEAPMYLVENSHPAIVSHEIYNRTQEEISRRKTRSPMSKKTALTSVGRYSKYALTGVLICGECGSPYNRVIWTSCNRRRVVWRCVNRLDYGKKYCHNSPTLPEEALHQAVVRAVNKFNEEDESTYCALMKATIGEAIGLDGGENELSLLQQKIDGLNRKMLELINTSVQEGGSIESNEGEFREISERVSLLKKRVKAIKGDRCGMASNQDRLKYIQKIIDERNMHRDSYDDTIVRQMIECIRVHEDGKLDVIFGGGSLVEEHI